jgi:hypothetical protein
VYKFVCICVCISISICICICSKSVDLDVCCCGRISLSPTTLSLTHRRFEVGGISILEPRSQDGGYGVGMMVRRNECGTALVRRPPPPRIRRLRKDRRDNRRRMAQVCRLSVFATRRHGRRPLNLIAAKMSSPDVNGLPSSTCPPRPLRRPRTSAYEPNARRQTLRHCPSLNATRHADAASIPATTASL